MIRVDRKLDSTDVVAALTDLFNSALARQNTYGLITAQSSSPRKSVIGSPLWALKLPTLSQVHHGKTVTVRALMRAFEMSC